jgi:hypothetical protein
VIDIFQFPGPYLKSLTSVRTVITSLVAGEMGILDSCSGLFRHAFCLPATAKPRVLQPSSVRALKIKDKIRILVRIACVSQTNTNYITPSGIIAKVLVFVTFIISVFNIRLPRPVLFLTHRYVHEAKRLTLPPARPCRSVNHYLSGFITT